MSYFIIMGGGDSNIPLLDPESGCPSYLFKREEIDSPEIMTFRFGKPIPRRPVMGDYFSAPDSVVSDKVYDVLAPMQILGLQLLQARIVDKGGKIHDGYWAIHLYNRIKCIDLDQSILELHNNSIDEVEALVLDQKVLEAIPLAERLAFRLAEDSGFQIYHESIVEKILAVDPLGLKFINVEDWDEDSYF